MWGYLLSAVGGAALAYFLDPDRGKRRRNMARDRAAATVRRGLELVGRRARYAGSTAQGLAEKATHSSDEAWVPLDDATLAHKVESELFRDPGVLKGKININVEDGVVVLRGQVEQPDEINSIIEKVEHVGGVMGVENLLHLPDTPAV
jgi:osmotically-inducible protein OsmY